jgi:hypothetical protein
MLVARGDAMGNVATTLFSRDALGRPAVLEGGRLAGYPGLEDALHVLTVSTAGGQARPGRPS